MSNEELIKAARYYAEYFSYAGYESMMVRKLADALEQAEKERDTLLNDLIETADNCKQDGVFAVCFCCKKRNSCYYLGSSSEDMECEFEWMGMQE